MRGGWLPTCSHSPELQIALRLVRSVPLFRRRGRRARRRPHGACLSGPAEPDHRPGREPGRFVLDSCQMLLTGTLADHAEQMAARLAQPDHPSIPHLAAPAAALGFAQRGDLERARQIASCWFAPPPRSFTWLAGDRLLGAGRYRTGGPGPRLAVRPAAPHAGELAIVGMSATAAVPSTACWPGSPGALAASMKPPNAPRLVWNWRPGSAPRSGSTGPKTSSARSLPRTPMRSAGISSQPPCTQARSPRRGPSGR